MHEIPSHQNKEVMVYNGASSEGSRLLYLEPYDIDTTGKEAPEGLREIWQLIRTRFRIIIGIVVLGGIGGALLTLQQTPIYQAKSTLEIQAPSESYLGFQSNSGAAGFSPEYYVQTQVRVLQSDTLRRRVIASLKQKGQLRYLEPNSLYAWRRALGFSAPSQVRLERQGAPPFEVRVRGYEGTQIVAIDCDSPDPQFSAAYLNAMSDEYIQSHIEARWDASQRITSWLSKQLDDLKQRLENSERELQSYSFAEGLVPTDDKNSIQEERLKQVQAELSKAQSDRVAKQSAYEIAKAASADSVPQVIDNERLSGYQIKLAELRRELAELSSLYTAEHYKVQRVKAQIQEVESTFDRERLNILRRINNEYEAALRRETLLTNEYASQIHQVSEKSGRLIQYDILKREVDTNRQLYDSLLSKMKEANVASAISASNIRVLDAAIAPSLPYKPTVLSNLLKGFVSGLLLALVLVLAGDRINRSLRAPGEAPFHLKVPELGVIPSSESVLSRDGGPPARTIDAIGSTNGIEDAEDCVELVTWQDSPSIMAESYRNVLTSILLSKGKARPKVMIVTSANRQEGKSAAVSNLGIALAEIGEKVLLIDADMRKPRLHQIFNCPNSWGLSDLLREKSILKDIPFEALARSTTIPGLFLLPSGPGAISISSLLYSDRMSELLDRTRTEFDAVVIDTPPMLYLSDARVLGRLVDAAILVIRAGHTTRDAALGAKQRLTEDGTPLLGTILNRWDLRAKGRYGSYDYHYEKVGS